MFFLKNLILPFFIFLNISNLFAGGFFSCPDRGIKKDYIFSYSTDCISDFERDSDLESIFANISSKSNYQEFLFSLEPLNDREIFLPNLILALKKSSLFRGFIPGGSFLLGIEPEGAYFVVKNSAGEIEIFFFHNDQCFYSIKKTGFVKICCFFPIFLNNCKSPLFSRFNFYASGMSEINFDSLKTLGC